MSEFIDLVRNLGINSRIDVDDKLDGSAYIADVLRTSKNVGTFHVERRQPRKLPPTDAMLASILSAAIIETGKNAIDNAALARHRAIVVC